MIELYQELYKTLRKHFKDYKDMGKKTKDTLKEKNIRIQNSVYILTPNFVKNFKRKDRQKYIKMLTIISRW